MEFRPEVLKSFAQNQESVQFQVAGAIKIHQGLQANGAIYVVMGPGGEKPTIEAGAPSTFTPIYRYC